MNFADFGDSRSFVPGLLGFFFVTGKSLQEKVSLGIVLARGKCAQNGFCSCIIILDLKFLSAVVIINLITRALRALLT